MIQREQLQHNTPGRYGGMSSLGLLLWPFYGLALELEAARVTANVHYFAPDRGGIARITGTHFVNVRVSLQRKCGWHRIAPASVESKQFNARKRRCFIDR